MSVMKDDPAALRRASITQFRRHAAQCRKEAFQRGGELADRARLLSEAETLEALAEDMEGEPFTRGSNA